VTAKPRAAVSWSGGKDSCAALARSLPNFDVVAMVTMCDEEGARSRSHGLRPEVLAAQADQLGLERIVGACTWETYDTAFAAAMEKLAAHDISHVIFGDILFDEHRQWAERQCARHGLTAIEPLFGSSTLALFDEWIASRSQALIVTAREPLLDATWLGRSLNREMLAEFASRGVDPCGERGEYHTLVVDSPLFNAPLHVSLGDAVQRGDCWALDVRVDA
jgi:diphthine-ammonia ligase